MLRAHLLIDESIIVNGQNLLLLLLLLLLDHLKSMREEVTKPKPKKNKIINDVFID